MSLLKFLGRVLKMVLKIAHHLPRFTGKDCRGKDKYFFKTGYFLKDHYSLFHIKFPSRYPQGQEAWLRGKNHRLRVKTLLLLAEELPMLVACWPRCSLRYLGVVNVSLRFIHPISYSIRQKLSSLRTHATWAPPCLILRQERTG